MAHEDRPRLARLRADARVAAHLRAIQRPAREVAAQPLEDRRQRRSDPLLHLPGRLAAGSPGLPRSATPAGKDVGPAAADLVVGHALPLALADLQQPGLRPDDDARGPRPVGGRRLGDRVRHGQRGLGRASQGEWTISSGRPAGTGSAGEACGRASRSPASAAWRRPAADSGVSLWPWNRFSTIHSDSPCRTRTSVASRPSGMSGEASGWRPGDEPSVTGLRPGGSSRSRSWRRRPGSRPPRTGAPRRRAPGPCRPRLGAPTGRGSSR